METPLRTGGGVAGRPPSRLPHPGQNGERCEADGSWQVLRLLGRFRQDAGRDLSQKRGHDILAVGFSFGLQ